MDNLTHTLVGLVVGETVSRTSAADPTGVGSETRRKLFVSLMAIGSNVPDLDFIQSRITDSKLDYLLHHRGHTHTILGALALSFILYLGCEAWSRWRQQRLSSRDRLQLIGVGLLASLLHIALDYTNSYGVHPFWPFDNRWYYGDAVFIVEPLFWAASAPLVFLLKTTLAKVFVALALIAALGLSIVTGMVPTMLCVALGALMIAMLAVGKLASARIALTTSLIVWLSVNAMFMYSSTVAAERARVLSARTFPNEPLLDHVLTSMPANPFCWSLMLVQANEDRWYVRRASLSLAPGWISADECPSRGNPREATAPMKKVDAPSNRAVVWINELQTERVSLNKWLGEDCDASAFMRFARAPWLAQIDDKWVIGDARFDNEPELSFAEFELMAGRTNCMSLVPSWTPPRAELLE
ncbi:MAG TPA: metal-dependent hydrolase [Steroidobacteraceae bacterium]|nr:metal-dependent hydrolase [Steroidobacteraceae bacterium]